MSRLTRLSMTDACAPSWLRRGLQSLLLASLAMPAHAVTPSRIFEPTPPPANPDTRGITPYTASGMPGPELDVLVRALGGMRGPAPSLVPHTESAPGYWNALGGLLRKKRGVSNSTAQHDESLGLSRADVGSTQQSSAPRVRFSGLKVGDYVELRFASAGCFGNYGGVVRYDAGPGGGQVSWYDAARLSSGAPDSLHQCGQQTASSSRLSKMDALLDYWRSGPEQRCSVATEITATLYRGGRPIAVEKFRDASCSVPQQALDLSATFQEMCGQ